MQDIHFLESDLGYGSFHTGERKEFQWKLTSEGCLMIHGIGKLSKSTEFETNSGEGWDGHYSSWELDWPWAELLPEIRKIVIGEGITEICNRAFMYYNNVTEVELPETLRVIGGGSFAGTSITRIHIPESVTRIYDGAFSQTKLPRTEEFYVDG